MKYVALLSGGKDSCYNLSHCQKNGHELVAAASLHPAQGIEELDSYMYQTVGQDAIEYVAKALDVPLYRKVISGNAVEQGLEYGSRNVGEGIEGDETEDLYTLLSTIKENHPEIQGVSVGAILSNYQRVRVEHVCRRLRLTPLAYLWQRDQGELLSEMVEAGLEAVLIKVAGIGLQIKHLGKTLQMMQPTLKRLHDLYESHICGEGGEYETLTLDSALFKYRIVLDEVETVIHSDNDFATVAYLRIKRASLVEKSPTRDYLVHAPPLLGTKELVDFRKTMELLEAQLGPVTGERNTLAACTTSVEVDVTSTMVGSWVSVSGVQRNLEGGSELSLEDEVRECFQILRGHLEKYNLSLSNCININLFLSSIDLFAQVNTVYATFFGTSPPSRACVAVDLSPDIRVRMDCIAFPENRSGDRQALHVQGLSYWAPANIGPYSQAIRADERVFVSGQIGLIPSDLTLPSPRSLATEMALSLQHTERVFAAFRSSSGGGWQGHAQAAVYWLAHREHVDLVRQGWSAFGRELETPTLFILVKSLPRNALIEKQVQFHTGRLSEREEEPGELSWANKTPKFKQGDISTPAGSKAHWEATDFEKEGTCGILCCKGEDISALSSQIKASSFSQFVGRTVPIRLFCLLGKEDSALRFYRECNADSNPPPFTLVPCRGVFTRSDDWDYAFYIFGQ